MTTMVFHNPFHTINNTRLAHWPTGGHLEALTWCLIKKKLITFSLYNYVRKRLI